MDILRYLLLLLYVSLSQQEMSDVRASYDHCQSTSGDAEGKGERTREVLGGRQHWKAAVD
jgi:hypothetical protein